jgi:hypothetical protein
LIELEACGLEAADQSEIATLSLLDNVSPDDASMRLLSLLAGVGGEEQSRDLDSQGQSPRRRITAKMSLVELPDQKSIASSSSCLSLERPSASTSSGSGLGLKRPSASKPVPSVVSELETPSDLLVKALREKLPVLSYKLLSSTAHFAHSAVASRSRIVCASTSHPSTFTRRRSSAPGALSNFD